MTAHTTKLTPDEIIQLGEGASRILNDEASKRAMDEVCAELQADWVATSPIDVSGRESIWRVYHGIGLFRAKLESYRDNAKVADFQAEQRKRDATSKGF